MSEIISASCPHGTRQDKEGVGKNGRPYRGLFCPSRICPPDWVAPSKVETPEVVAYATATRTAREKCNAIVAEARRVRDEAIAAAKAVLDAAQGRTAVPAVASPVTADATPPF